MGGPGYSGDYRREDRPRCSTREEDSPSWIHERSVSTPTLISTEPQLMYPPETLELKGLKMPTSRYESAFQAHRA